MILGRADDGPRDPTGTSRDGVGPRPQEGATSAVNLLRSLGRETTTDGDMHWDREQRGLGQNCTSNGRKEATFPLRDAGSIPHMYVHFKKRFYILFLIIIYMFGSLPAGLCFIIYIYIYI
jgi:hypothetical protein